MYVIRKITIMQKYFFLIFNFGHHIELYENIIFELARNKKPKFGAILSMQSKMAAKIHKQNNFFLHNFIGTYYIHILWKFHENITIFELAKDKKTKFWAIFSYKYNMAAKIKS